MQIYFYLDSKENATNLRVYLPNTLFGCENESSEEENLNHLIAIGILPGFDGGDTCGERRGSIHGKMANKAAKYDERDFERRFRMPTVIFNRIFRGIEGKGEFKRQSDCTGEKGIYPLI